MFTSPLEQVNNVFKQDSVSIGPSTSDATRSLEIVDIDIAIKIVDLKKSTVYGLVHQKQIPFIKQGKKLLFSRSALLQWMASRTQVYSSGSEVPCFE